MIFIISGPSRVGKNAIIKALKKIKKLDMGVVVTCTTRPKRKNEKHGRDYYFLPLKEFKKRIRGGRFLEWAKVRGYYFGTLKEEVEKNLKKSKRVILPIDVQGARQVKKKIPSVIQIFILPDSIEVLKKRMIKAKFSKEQMVIRLLEARREMKEAKKYDYRVINYDGKLYKAVKEVAKIIKKY